MPIIPPHVDPADLTRWQGQTDTVKKFLELHGVELQDEFGDFDTQVLPTGRILIIPEAEPDPESWVVCYMSDANPANMRLVVDDYVPELVEDGKFINGGLPEVHSDDYAAYGAPDDRRTT